MLMDLILTLTCNFSLLDSRAAGKSVGAGRFISLGTREIFFFAIVGLGGIASACVDPIREQAILELGDEVPEIPVGPLHRAGQPCLLCHDGAVATPFSVAGTIHLDVESDKPAVSALVRLSDGLGHEHRVATNCAGNFFVRPGDFDPAWPLWARIEYDGWIQEMESPINADGSCGSCHAPSTHPQSAGPVYVYPFASEPREVNCQ